MSTKTYPESLVTGPDGGRRHLTKRELFAAMAMQGFCSSEWVQELPPTTVAKLAVGQADALIDQLNKVQP